jgi:hypothetical protein
LSARCTVGSHPADQGSWFWSIAASVAANRRYFGISPAFEFGSAGAGAAGAAGAAG